jgi:putative SOS response-associated peptidase YedK
MPGRFAVYDDVLFKKDASSLIKNDYIQHINSNYNTAPTHAIAVLLNNGNYLYAHFGYIPAWKKDRKTIHLNARSESIFEKSTFREAYKKNRCIIPINGYYEWLDGIPYFINDSKKNYFALAGIWSEWWDEELKQYILNVALVTCPPNEAIEKIHHRMPVILEKEDLDTWLQNDDINVLNKLFKIYPSEKIQYHTVNKSINKVSFNDKSSIEEFENKQTGQLSLF